MHKKENRDYDCIIIGAGISGLMAGRKLMDNNIDLLILDKGRKPGGRISTRIVGNLRFDHGAQVLSGSSDEFSSLLNEWKRNGIIQASDFQNSHKGENRDVDYYCVKNGFSKLPRLLASGLNVRTECKVVHLSIKNKIWSVKSANNELFSAKTIIITLPVPQALELLSRSGVDLPRKIHAGLSNIEYERCLALLLKGRVLDEFSNFEFIKPKREPVALIVNNYAKGVSAEKGAVTIHTIKDFSEKNWATADHKLADMILTGSKDYLQYNNGYLQIHRWRYSRAISSYPEPYLILDDPGRLAFAGDGFAGKDIEGAALSGLRVAEAIIS